MYPCQPEYGPERQEQNCNNNYNYISEYKAQFTNKFDQQRDDSQYVSTNNNFNSSNNQASAPPYYQAYMANTYNQQESAQQDTPMVYIDPYWTSFCTQYASCPTYGCGQQHSVANCQPTYPTNICPQCHRVNCQRQQQEGQVPQSVWVNYTINPYAGCISIQKAVPAECIDNALEEQVAAAAFWDDYCKQMNNESTPETEVKEKSETCTEREEHQSRSKKPPPADNQPENKKRRSSTSSRSSRSKSKTRKGKKKDEKPSTSASPPKQTKKRRRSSSVPQSDRSLLPPPDSIEHRPIKSKQMAEFYICEPPAGYPPQRGECIPCPPRNPTPPPPSCTVFDDQDSCSCFSDYYRTEQFLCSQRSDNNIHQRKLQFCKLPVRVPRETGRGCSGTDSCLRNTKKRKSKRSFSCDCTCPRNLR